LLKIAHHSAYIHPVDQGHRFPMLKYELIVEQLLYEGVVSDEQFFEPKLASKQDICLAHDRKYVEDLLSLQLNAKMIRRIGFPLTQLLVDRELYLVQGSIEASLHALQNGIAFNTAGGTHHAGRDFGEGFCLLNDQAVAAAYLYNRGLANRILIIDLDVHQGNGTAHIFQDHPNIITLSVHGDKNFPFIKEKSHYDFPLEDGVSDEAYLSLLSDILPKIFREINPDFVFYQAGVDVLATDKLGKLKLTQLGCRLRDEQVFMLCNAHHVPVQVSMGGGYSQHIQDIVNAHVNTFRSAIKIFDF